MNDTAQLMEREKPEAPASKLASWAIRLLVCLLVLTGPGCSIRKMAINKLGDALSGAGTTFASDEDPELVKASVPFSLKLMESLLAEVPQHKGLLRATCSGFTQYGYAFVQQDADELADQDLDKAGAMRLRARKLYLRARDYGLRGLDASHPGFTSLLKTNPVAAAKLGRKPEVPLLYWTAVSWAAAVALSKDNSDLVGDLPMVEALIDRALELQEDYEAGAIHTFLITFEMSRPKKPDDPALRSRKHFERALTLSGGLQAGPLVALAEEVALANQNKEEFKSLLEKALAVNVDAKPEWRLANLVYQRRARWLLDRMEKLFL